MRIKRELSRNQGFSLLELLVVIAIILVILSVAIPSIRRAHIFAQEMAAQKAISTIQTAEMQYYAQYGRYATSLFQLGPSAIGVASANGADLIDRELASGEKGNFKFRLSADPSGYTLTAEPTQFGVSGIHTYYSDPSMRVHEHSGQQPATVNDPLPGEKDR